MKIPTDREMLAYLHRPAGGATPPTARGDLLNTREASKYLNVPRETLSNWRKARPRPVGPRFYRLPESGQVRYSIADLDAYLDACKVETS